MSNNQYSFWYPNQTVTQANWDTYSQDLYNRFGEITANAAITGGTILNIGAITQVTGNSYSFTAGAFVYPPNVFGYMTYNPNGIIGNAPAATVTFPTGSPGYFVARYTVSPTTITAENYTLFCTYQFVSSVDPIIDCMICQINAAGVIIAYGNYYINQAATPAQVAAGVANNVAVTPAGLVQSGLIFPLRAKGFYIPGVFTFTVPANVIVLLITGTGGGGGGAGGVVNQDLGSGNGGGGGASGATAFQNQYNVTPGMIITGTIGSGGQGGFYALDGTSGGTTSINGSGIAISLVGGTPGLNNGQGGTIGYSPGSGNPGSGIDTGLVASVSMPGGIGGSNNVNGVGGNAGGINTQAKEGFNGGGGGGGGSITDGGFGNGSNGGNGYVLFEW